MAPTTDVTILAGDQDEVVGRAGADRLFGLLAAQPARSKHFRLVRSKPGFVASHEALKGTGAKVFATFWAPLDALAVRGRG